MSLRVFLVSAIPEPVPAPKRLNSWLAETYAVPSAHAVRTTAMSANL